MSDFFGDLMDSANEISDEAQWFEIVKSSLCGVVDPRDGGAFDRSILVERAMNLADEYIRRKHQRDKEKEEKKK
jgi:hypothetical protein